MTILPQASGDGTEMRHIILLNEFSLFRVVGLRARNRRPFLLGINPIFPPSHGILQRIARRLLRAGWLRDIESLDPHAADFQARMPLFPCKGWYARSEGIFVGQAGLATKLRPDSSFDRAVCKQAVNFGAEQLQVMQFIHEMTRKSPHLQMTLLGCPPLMEKVHKVLREPSDRTEFVPSRPPRRLINAALTLMAVARAVGHVIRYTEIRPAPRRKILLAIDAIDNLDRLVPAVNDILDDVGRQGLYVFRNRQSFEALKEGLQPYPLSPYPDGQFGPRECLSAGLRALTGAAQLYIRFSALNPRLFLQVVKLCAVRASFEGLLNKYDIANFLARDEYNAEHIIRSQELRRRGAVSMGLVNGVNVFGVDSVFRYCDHDITYVFSPGPFLRHNGDNWRQPLDVRQIGALGLTRAEIREMTQQEKPRDIVCFAKTYCDGEYFLDQAFKIGRTFPERNVFISLKKSATRLGGGPTFFDYMKNAPPNVTLVDAPSFQLIKRCRYVLSGESSIISEAINLGSFAFFLDTYPADEIYIYRDYPNLSYSDGNDIARRIEAIENGSWRYPREEFADLADLSGWLSFDVIRRDIGLPPIDPPLLHAMWQDSPSPPATREAK